MKNPNEKNLNDKLDNFIDGENQEECTGEECLIKGSKDLVERVNKKLVTEDGRELLL